MVLIKMMGAFKEEPESRSGERVGNVVGGPVWTRLKLLVSYENDPELEVCYLRITNHRPKKVTRIIL